MITVFIRNGDDRCFSIERRTRSCRLTTDKNLFPHKQTRTEPNRKHYGNRDSFALPRAQ
jgi:hypothetical protein